MSGFFHIPFQGRNISSDINDNFLYQYNNIYIMDNHRLALWAWLNELDLKKRYNLLHIDAHPDMSNSAIADYQNLNLKAENLTLAEYRKLEQASLKIPLFRWDNYLPIFLNYFSRNYIKETSISFTHHQGSKEHLTKDLESNFLLRECENIFFDKVFINESNWIVNLDLDYFFSSQPHKVLMFSENFLQLIARAIKKGLDDKIISVLTIAFSPECCGSWDNAEFVFNVLNKELNIPMVLK